jgi:hypothetical protein
VPHGVFAQRRVASEQSRTVGVAPGEEVGIADQAVFHDFGVTGLEFALGQRVEHGEVCEHERGLVECADEIFAGGGVDRGLAPHARIDLRKQRRGQLDEVAAALEDRRGKTGEIANHPAAEREDMVAALDFLGKQPVDRRGEVFPALGRLAGREDAPRRLVSGRMQCLLDYRAPGGMDVAVGDHRDTPLAQSAVAMLNQSGEQSRAHDDFVGPTGDVDRDYSHSLIPLRTLPTVRECGPLVLFTWIGACA